MSQNLILLFLIAACFNVVNGMDDPVAFTAIKGFLNGNYISFQAVIVNNKADFTQSYGAFKCHRPGIYYFTFSAISQEGKDLRVSLRANGIPVVTIYGGGSASYNSASGAGLMELVEGDLVYLFVEKGQIFESNNINRAYTTFSGFQIMETKSKGIFSSIMGGRNHPHTFLEKDPSDDIYNLVKSNTTMQGNHRPNHRTKP